MLALSIVVDHEGLGINAFDVGVGWEFAGIEDVDVCALLEIGLELGFGGLEEAV